MIVGIGIDIVQTAKIEKAVKRLGENFLKRVFTQEELSPIALGKMYYQRLAARFAAKEAVIKAICKQYPMALTDIIILNKPNGAPYCKLKKKIGLEILLSITHIEEYAVACAVAQKKIRHA
jgi:holo-[acyl-carrier protein] synthase